MAKKMQVMVALKEKEASKMSDKKKASKMSKGKK